MNQDTEALQAKDVEEMAKYGIVRQPVDYFLFDTFRYTSLKDAVAQAKRCENATEV